MDRRTKMARLQQTGKPVARKFCECGGSSIVCSYQNPAASGRVYFVSCEKVLCNKQGIPATDRDSATRYWNARCYQLPETKGMAQLRVTPQGSTISIRIG